MKYDCYTIREHGSLNFIWIINLTDKDTAVTMKGNESFAVREDAEIYGSYWARYFGMIGVNEDLKFDAR